MVGGSGGGGGGGGDAWLTMTVSSTAVVMVVVVVLGIWCGPRVYAMCKVDARLVGCWRELRCSLVVFRNFICTYSICCMCGSYSNYIYHPHNMS